MNWARLLKLSLQCFTGLFENSNQAANGKILHWY